MKIPGHLRLMNNIHFPTLFLCGGSVFTVSVSHHYTTNILCQIWIALGLFLYGAYFCLCIVNNCDYTSKIEAILKTFFLIGIAEIGLALLQILDLYPSHNIHFHFTGSFDNPAILAMYLSLCFPIGLYFSKKAILHKLVWDCMIVFVGIFLILSNSRIGIICACCSGTLIDRRYFLKKLRYMSLQKTIVLLVLFTVLLFLGLYFYKQDSANGRMLIWKICVDMIIQKPICEWGVNGFDAHYMPFQAEYFLQHPNSNYLLLADSLIHPFNEFLFFAIRYGIISLSFLILCVGKVFRSLILSSNSHKSLFISLYVTILLWCLFSYPYQIPFMWLVTIYIISITLYPTLLQWKHGKCVPFLILTAYFIFLISTSIPSYKYKMEWAKIQEKSLAGETKVMIPLYANLYEHLKENGAFLYNYGAELHYAKDYHKSLEVLNECTKMYNDYNVQMLIADNYQQLGFAEKAIEKYKYANRMIPNRFLPLYYQMKIHIEKGDYTNACKIANTIINKPIKIKKSNTVKQIINEAKAYLYYYGQQ